jgi:branched-chain amino acid transport system permease protein
MSAFEEFVQAIVQGLPVGAVFALIAIGFVLTYKTSGVFNLAFGAQAFVSAAAYFELHVRREWPIWSSLLISVGVLAPLVGVAMERLVFRHLHGASATAKLVASLGLLIAIPEAFTILVDFDREPTFGAVGIVPDGRTTYLLFDRYPVTRDEIVQLTVAVVGALALAAMFRFTNIGLRMRAVVESPRMTEQRGIDAERVSAFAWALSSLFAGLAGVLLATRFTTLEPVAFFQLIVVAIAAAAIGRLVSLPWALAGGLFLGVLTTLLTTYLDPTTLLAQQLGPSLPFLMLFAVVVLVPSLRSRREQADPLAGVDPPPPTALVANRNPSVVRGTQVAWWAGLALLALWTLVSADDFWVLTVTDAVIFAIIFLSVTVFTGLGGQISLALAAFASMGAFAVAQLADRFEMPVLAGALVGAAIAAVVGMALALPVLRLGGVWLALSTLAFALFYDAVIVKLDWVGGSALQGTEVPRPVLGSIDFTNGRSYFVLCLVALGVVGLVVALLARGTVGQALRALRADELAAQSVGVIPSRARLLAFGLASGVAGFGGALLAVRQGAVNYSASFTPFVGLFWVLIVVALSARTVSGAILAGLAFKVLPELGSSEASGGSTPWLFVVFGLAAITFARHPEGIAEHLARRLQQQLSSLVGRARRAQPAQVDNPVAEKAA